MAFAKKTETTEKTNKTLLDLASGFYSYSIKNARILSDKVATFTLDLGIGVALYNMKCVERNDGGFFISVPQTAGKNGGYFNQYSVYLTKESEQLLIDEIMKILS